MTITLVAKLVFWMSAAALFYTYIGYPLLLVLISKMKPRSILRRDSTPRVTVIITAHNEELALALKLENTLALDYPKSNLEVIVASDCSSDRTDAIVREFGPRGVKLYRQPTRLGKTAAQNAAVACASGEIIVFSDATTYYEQNVLRVLMPNFADASVGCATGRLVYKDLASSSVGHGTRSYWGYESFLRKHESSVCSLIGVCGCLYAVRRSAYVPLYHEACSDFVIATKMVEQGLRAVYEPAAVCTEETNIEAGKELQTRVRIITQTFADLWRNRRMLNPLRSGFFAVQLFSHKVMRYLIPLFLFAILMVSTSLAPSSTFFTVILILQLAFYVAAGLAWFLERSGFHSRLLAIPHYFVLGNLASVIAFYQFLRGERYIRWDPIRTTEVSSS